MIARLVTLAALTLVLGAIIHLVTILAVPRLATADGWSRLMALTHDEGITVLPEPRPDSQALPQLDPAIAYAVCPFDLSEQPFAITAVLGRHYWSASFHTRDGTVFYAVNDDAALMGIFDIELRTAAQTRQFRMATPQAGEQKLFLEVPAETGIALFRALVPFRSERAATEAALRETYCGPLAVEPEEEGTQPGAIPLPRPKPSA